MFDSTNNALIAISEKKEISLFPKMANRHGLITGATGTGKTVTLQTLAETFSQMGVPVFTADVKGDFSGIGAVGKNTEHVTKRIESFNLTEKGFLFQSFPVQLWDIAGENGTPIRATIAEMGPLLLSKLLSLNDTQSSVLTILFKLASDRDLALINLQDIQKLIEYATNNTDELAATYGNLSTSTLATIQRNFIAFEHTGQGIFLGEPALDINDLLQTRDGKGVVNIIYAQNLFLNPAQYTTFLMWLLQKLFTELPEVGDLDKPKLVFFFDEAHLLFSGSSKDFIDKVEQIVRLIRSKGVGVYFISQSPADIPDNILGQLGNKIQHALRAYTPKDQKAIKAAADSFRANPDFSTATAITELGIGEALVSFLDEKGAPTMVERAFILPPQGQINPLDAAARTDIISSSPLHQKYITPTNRLSAFEKLSENPDTSRTAAQKKAQEKEATSLEKKEEKKKLQEEKTQLKQEELRHKQEAKEFEKTKKIFVDTAKDVFIPVAKQFLKSLFKK